MPTSHPCETAALRLHWAARLLGSEDGESKPRVEGRSWEDIINNIGRSTRPRAFQGRGVWKLFGSHGASGLNTEFDMALDYGGAHGLVMLVEAKAHADRTLSRDHALVFSGKIRDHVASPAWKWPHAQMLVASAGRVEPSFCHWCFYEGIDVTDPDRFPLSVLARLPALFPVEFQSLAEVDDHERLVRILCHEDEDPESFPVLLRRECSPKRLEGRGLLNELGVLQARLSENLFAAMMRARFQAEDEEKQEAMLLARVRSYLAEKGIRLPPGTARHTSLD